MAENPAMLFNRLGQDSIGKMYMFYYDAKTKDKLPYWDRFPLIFVLDVRPDRFWGVNLHYLPPLYRAKLMNALYKIQNNGKTPLTMYVRAELLPGDYKPSPDIVVVDRFDNDRRVGAHWVHICNGGPSGLNLCTVAPRTIPQQHSHPNEELWLSVKGESILSLGKDTRKMTPGMAYRIPPTGLVAHSNINLGEEPVEMIYMGPADRTVDAAWVASRGGKLQGLMVAGQQSPLLPQLPTTASAGWNNSSPVARSR